MPTVDQFPARIMPHRGKLVHLARNETGAAFTACGRRVGRYWLSAGQRYTCVACRNVMQPHGTRARYIDGCRCDTCRTASTTYHRERHARVAAHSVAPLSNC